MIPLKFFTARCYTERRTATANRASVCLSVRPFVTFGFFGHIGWNISKIISWLPITWLAYHHQSLPSVDKMKRAIVKSIAETTACRSHCQFITFITLLSTVTVIRQMAPLFSKVDSNKLWHYVQNEETVISAKFGKDLFNICKVICRKTKWPRFLAYPVL